MQALHSYLGRSSSAQSVATHRCLADRNTTCHLAQNPSHPKAHEDGEPLAVERAATPLGMSSMSFREQADVIRHSRKTGLAGALKWLHASAYFSSDHLLEAQAKGPVLNLKEGS